MSPDEQASGSSDREASWFEEEVKAESYVPEPSRGDLRRVLVIASAVLLTMAAVFVGVALGTPGSSRAARVEAPPLTTASATPRWQGVMPVLNAIVGDARAKKPSAVPVPPLAPTHASLLVAVSRAPAAAPITRVTKRDASSRASLVRLAAPKKTSKAKSLRPSPLRASREELRQPKPTVVAPKPSKNAPARPVAVPRKPRYGHF